MDNTKKNKFDHVYEGKYTEQDIQTEVNKRVAEMNDDVNKFTESLLAMDISRKEDSYVCSGIPLFYNTSTSDEKKAGD